MLIYEKIILKYLVKAIYASNDAWNEALVKESFSKEQINHLTQIVSKKIAHQLLGINREFRKNLQDFLVYSEQQPPKEFRRVDYFGRAIIDRGFADYFPKTEEESERILSEEIEGRLPRAIAVGLIDAIKCAEGIDIVQQNELACIDVARKYFNEETKTVEWRKFYKDEQIIALVSTVYRLFKQNFYHLDENFKKTWLLERITSTERFEEMKRELTEREYKKIVDIIMSAS